MIKLKQLGRLAFLLTVLLGLGCGRKSTQAPAEKPISTDNNLELTKVYTQAISEFIKAVYKKDQTRFDTLFFGKHTYGQADDFPPIKLPSSIENTHIQLISTEQGNRLQSRTKPLVYINLMGWVTPEKAEFLFVVFSNGFAHQYDYYIHFIKPVNNKEYQLEKIEWENFKQPLQTKPKRLGIFRNGEYCIEH